MNKENLESKFNEQSKANPRRWFWRIILESGYAWRNAKALPKETENLANLKKMTIGFEIGRLGAYGFVAYKIAEHFIK